MGATLGGMKRSILALALLIGNVSAADHDGFCTWDEMTKSGCKNVFTGKWECWCPKLTTPVPPD